MTVALSEAERAQARDYLGVTMLSTDRDPRTYGSNVPYGLTDGNLVMEGNFRSILDTHSYTIVKNLLNEIEASRAFINQARKLLLVEKVEGAATINRKMMSALWAEDYKLVSDLANKLGTYVFWHPFKDSGSGYGTRAVGGTR